MTSRRLLDDTGKVLLDAAGYIEEHGWCKRTLRARDGRVCAIGAIRMAAAATALEPQSLAEEVIVAARIEQKVMSAAWRLSDHIGDNVAIWNDRAKRTKEEVITALREAAICRPR